jgi:hypothetical protein
MYVPVHGAEQPRQRPRQGPGREADRTGPSAAQVPVGILPGPAVGSPLQPGRRQVPELNIAQLNEQAPR